MITQADTLIYRNREGSMSRVEEGRDWTAWFPWSRADGITPAGAATDTQLPVHSADPPIISVVIPVGPGHARYLLDAVDSVDAQTFRQWECIVVNDTGGDLPRLPSWARVIDPERRTGKNPRCFGGVAAARNAGIAAAHGKYFLPLDADDYLQPQSLQVMLRAAEETGDVVYSDFWEDGGKYPDGSLRKAGDFAIYRCPDWDPELLTVKGAISAVTQLTPVALWREVGGYDETIEAWEDWAFQLSLAARGYCSRRIPLPLWTYRKHTGQRRDANYEVRRTTGRDAIMKRFGGYWRGEKLMACRTCGGARTYAPAASGNDDKPSEDAVMMRFEAPQSGASAFRAPAVMKLTGNPYRFRGGEEKWVLRDDVEWLIPRGFLVVSDSAPVGVRQDAPTLTAPRLDTAGTASQSTQEPAGAAEAPSGDTNGAQAPEGPVGGDVVTVAAGSSLEDVDAQIVQKATRKRTRPARA
jgi:GT2 family glycosyltransferase